MKGKRARIIALVLSLILALPSMPGTAAAAPAQPLSIVFTHDMHSHLEAVYQNPNKPDKSAGGFARLATLVGRVRGQYPDTLLLDAGDFSMGTLYQTIFTSDAPELALMGALGFDATTLGNHEFDYRAQGLSQMLIAAAQDAGAPVPLLSASIDWDATLDDRPAHDGRGAPQEPVGDN